MKAPLCVRVCACFRKRRLAPATAEHVGILFDFCCGCLLLELKRGQTCYYEYHSARSGVAPLNVSVVLHVFPTITNSTLTFARHAAVGWRGYLVSPNIF